jgi:alkylation response protein AidB-like acyl-CoA dehydrogenase
MHYIRLAYRLHTVSTREASRAEDVLAAGGAEAVRAAARAVSRALAERAGEHDRDGTFPSEAFEAIWTAGLGNLTLPRALGGVGADLETSAEVVALLAAGDPSAALVLVMHLAHIPLLALPGSGCPPRVRRAFLESTLAGPALANALRVEPELGTPARGGIPATRGRLVRSAAGELEWSVSGRKIFSTGAPGLRWMLVWGATQEDQRIGWFVVPGDTPGVSIEQTWDHLGMRASASHDVVLDDVRIPFDHAFALSEPGAAPASGRDAATVGAMLVLLLSVYLGVAQGARDWLVAYLHERVPTNLGAPLASLPRMQSAVGEIEARLVASRRLIMSLARDPLEAPLVKTVVTRELIEAVQTAVALVGNAGLTRHHPLQRHLRDVLCSRVHTPQEDAVFLSSGRLALAKETQ